jgi:signal transduction histidine kinase
VDDASHELRTPLALLKTELELALRHPRSRDELEETLRAAADDTDRLVRLSEDLLLIARADQGQIPIRPEVTSARMALATVAERFEARAAQAGTRIVVGDGADAFVDADPARLEQALGNLVENALVHGAGPVALEVQASDDGVELHVLDSGPGLPRHFSRRAFDRFSRADDARAAGGTGLGLAIVDLIARRHGGHAEIRSRDGRGADAVIILPRVSAADPGPATRMRAGVSQS